MSCIEIEVVETFVIVSIDGGNVGNVAVAVGSTCICTCTSDDCCSRGSNDIAHDDDDVTTIAIILLIRCVDFMLVLYLCAVCILVL